MSVNFHAGPAENEIECALCGALFSYELARCPNCGASLYALEVERQDSRAGPSSQGLLERLRFAAHSLFQIPYLAEEVFGDSLDLSGLYEDLLHRLGGDRSAADRLVEFEHQLLPSATRFACIRSAIQRLGRGEDAAQRAS